MSMIGELVRRLRKCAERTQSGNGNPAAGMDKLLREAADTIEELSAKLSAANMERSCQHYNGGWIPCGDLLPEPGKIVLVCQTFSRIKDGKSAVVTVGRLTPKEEGYRPYWEFLYYRPNFKKGSVSDIGIICPGNEYVAAWRPLPEPFKGGKNNAV